MNKDIKRRLDAIGSIQYGSPKVADIIRILKESLDDEKNLADQRSCAVYNPAKMPGLAEMRTLTKEEVPGLKAAFEKLAYSYGMTRRQMLLEGEVLKIVYSILEMQRAIDRITNILMDLDESDHTFDFPKGPLSPELIDGIFTLVTRLMRDWLPRLNGEAVAEVRPKGISGNDDQSGGPVS